MAFWSFPRLSSTVNTSGGTQETTTSFHRTVSPRDTGLWSCTKRQLWGRGLVCVVSVAWSFIVAYSPLGSFLPPLVICSLLLPVLLEAVRMLFHRTRRSLAESGRTCVIWRAAFINLTALYVWGWPWPCQLPRLQNPLEAINLLERHWQEFLQRKGSRVRTNVTAKAILPH